MTTRDELIETMAKIIDHATATNMAGYAKLKGFDISEVEELKRNNAAWNVAKSKATAVLSAIEAAGDVVYLRDLDGTGSMHPCSKGDPGAIAYYPL